VPFEITTEGDVRLIRLFGVVTTQDLARLSGVLDALDGVSAASTRWVTDFTTVQSFAIGYSAVLDFAQHWRARKLPNQIKSALIVRHEVEVGFARMFQALNDIAEVEIRIFRSLEEAKDWFG
jgi:hypothetical protein